MTESQVGQQFFVIEKQLLYKYTYQHIYVLSEYGYLDGLNREY